MAYARDPILHPVPIDSLRPTQITVGMREVAAKRKAWRTKGGDKGAEFLGQHMIPVIWGRRTDTTSSTTTTLPGRSTKRGCRTCSSQLSQT
jgi:hypothetical protein